MKDYQYYLDHFDELVEKYDGYVLLIVNRTVVGTYHTEAEAYKDAIGKYEPGTFLIHKCKKNSPVYSTTIHAIGRKHNETTAYDMPLRVWQSC